MQDLAEIIHQCELEKLHLSGASQAWGALIYIDSKHWIISHATENISDYINCKLETFVGTPVSQWGDLAYMIAKVTDAEGAYSTFFNQSAGFSKAVDVRVISGKNCVVIELEPAIRSENVIEIHPIQRQLLMVPGNEDGLLIQHELLLKALQNIIQFDRLMIYRFHDDWSGEVLAEHTTQENGSYLHLRF